MCVHRVFAAGVFIVFVSLAVGAQPAERDQDRDVAPLRNWAVPMEAATSHHVAADSLLPSPDAIPSAPSHFIATVPCRIVDTRGAAGPFGGPAFAASQTRTFTMPSGPCTGLPVAAAYSLNFTIVSYDATLGASGFVTTYPSGGTRPVVSTVNFGSGPPVANAAVVPASATGAIDVFASGATHLIIDVNGYFVEGVVTSIAASGGLAGSGTGAVNLSIANGGVTPAKLSATGSTTGQVLTSTGSAVQWQNAGVAGPAGGDLSGTYPNPAVAQVGGQPAGTIASGVVLANAATNANTGNTIVSRDASGNFSAGTITAALNGNATSATSFTGPLAGEVTGTQSASVVSNAVSTNTANRIVRRDATGNFSAGTITAALNGNAATATTATNFAGALAGEVTGVQTATVVSNAVAANAANAIVRRDASGDFSAGTVTVAGNLALPASSASGGAITLGGSPFLRSYGLRNVFVGNNAGNLTTTGQDHSAFGYQALQSNTSGVANTAIGSVVLQNNTTGSGNTAVGHAALSGNISGSNNIAVGENAGSNLTTGDGNLDIGHSGVAAESATIRIGTAQSRAFIAGIHGVTTAGAATPVVVDSSGQLGTASPSGTLGPAGGDLSGTYPNPTVATVGGQAAANVASGAALANAATNGNASGAIVRRDPSGNFSASDVTVAHLFSVSDASAARLLLPITTSTTGSIVIDTATFLHAYGTANTFVGQNAGNFSLSGSNNAAVGTNALSANSTGYGNSAVGMNALARNNTGFWNTGIGSYALYNSTTGTNNVAVGVAAMQNSTSGTFNTAVGEDTLFQTTGTRNIALGYDAGFSVTSGSYNIDIGNAGVAAESNTTRIGDANQTRTFVSGIRGVTTGNANAVNVVIDSAGQLGTLSSSRRFKFDINDMADTTDGLMRLRPVTFRYRAHGANAPIQYGLIAEEVAEVYPELVTRDENGQVETVMYQFLAPMLLNEVQRQQKVIDSLSAHLTDLEQRLQRLEEALAKH